MRMTDEPFLDLDADYRVSMPVAAGRLILAPELDESSAVRYTETREAPPSELQLAVIAELSKAAESIRSGGRPGSVLHALLAEDGLSLGRIAGKTQKPVSDVELTLLLLSDAGWVERTGDGSEATYYVRGRRPV